MEDFRKLYFHLFGKVADVIEEYENIPAYKEIVNKLIVIEQETEELYMDMPSEDDEVTDED